MNDLSRLSRLPQSPEYWDHLGNRIRAEAVPLIEGERAAETWPRLAAGMSLLAAAVASVLLMLPSPTPVEPSITSSISPADPVATSLLSLDAPPTVSALFAVHVQRSE